MFCGVCVVGCVVGNRWCLPAKDLPGLIWSLFGRTPSPFWTNLEAVQAGLSRPSSWELKDLSCLRKVLNVSTDPRKFGEICSHDACKLLTDAQNNEDIDFNLQFREEINNA